ncbi:hypothetical protein, partial [Frankia sp. Cr1]|uniref:hypothetical protein n=1 Tax=Frankia sp. Cr1 TaxID=3073931 RepID=UPI002AD3F7EE
MGAVVAPAARAATVCGSPRTRRRRIFRAAGARHAGPWYAPVGAGLGRGRPADDVILDTVTPD